MSSYSISQEILAATTNPDLKDVNLTNCDREPIHIPNLIQPHGVLLAVSATEYKIVQVSLNTLDMLGREPQSLLEKPLSELLGEEQVQAIQRCLSEDFDNINPLAINLRREGKNLAFKAIVHRYEKIILVEFEPSQPTQELDFFNFYKLVKSPITRIQNTHTLLLSGFVLK